MPFFGLKCNIFVINLFEYNQNKICFLIQYPNHLENMEKSGNFVNMEKSGKNQEIPKLVGNHTVNEIS